MNTSRKKWWIIGISALAVLLIAGGITFFIVLNKSADKKAKDAAVAFTNQIARENYAKLDTYVTSKSLKAVDFTKKDLETKYTTVFGGLGVKDVQVDNLQVTPGENSRTYDLTYDLNMQTSLGKLKTQSYKSTISKEDEEWKVDWVPALVFPGMVKDDKVRLVTDEAKRGDILDRNQKKLATIGNFNEAGVVPEKLGEGDEKTQNIMAISQKLDVPAEEINHALEQKWVKADSFVPIKTILSGNLPESTGLAYAQKELRTYPLNQATAHLIGYVGEVSAEDIEKNPQLNVGDIIGKTGLERYYDKKLRGKNGGEIKIINDRTKQESTLQKVARNDGEPVHLTIDADIQKKAFDSLGNEAGAVTMINPQSGDLLALVSTPSYDANKMAAGISASDYKKYSEDKRTPFLARYATRYAPGSTFKTITAGIGLDLGVTTPDKTRQIDGLKWQKDASWGNYFVTRVHEKPSVNMTDALVYSDNIYFAQEGLEIGKDRLTTGLKKFDFDQEFDLPFSMEPAQISNDGLNSDILLADTSYGQGELLMSPVQQAVAYTAIANGGKMVYPKLASDAKQAESKQAIKAESANLVKDALIKTVSDPNGTAHKLNSSHKIAAKTGTAELKQKQGEDGLENGFLYAFDAENPNYLILGMIEDVKGRGGSSLVIDKLKPVIESMY
ncbi:MULTISPECIES: penicillin-binding transpeptidase domain-containing protein [Listeria]|uniref:penicillin-binding protein PBP4(5) n=1 Tax=Listeria TaxID=1637 RepID=UPI000B588F34|nr:MULTISPECIES: penicillin-binding transpeptidase domain-containing protein [Listeria]